MICFVMGMPHSVSNSNNNNNMEYENNIWNGVENLSYYNNYDWYK